MDKPQIMTGIEGEKFTYRLRELWSETNMTQKELAKRIGIKETTLLNYLAENKLEVKPTKTNFWKICDYFDINPQYFKGEKEKSSRELLKEVKDELDNLKEEVQNDQGFFAKIIGVFT